MIYSKLKSLPGHLYMVHSLVCESGPSLLQPRPCFAGSGLVHVRERV